jgi:hypothetical protein
VLLRGLFPLTAGHPNLPVLLHRYCTPRHGGATAGRVVPGLP